MAIKQIHLHVMDFFFARKHQKQTAQTGKKMQIAVIHPQDAATGHKYKPAVKHPRCSPVTTVCTCAAVISLRMGLS